MDEEQMRAKILDLVEGFESSDKSGLIEDMLSLMTEHQLRSICKQQKLLPTS